jgi:hypothetical protein
MHAVDGATSRLATLLALSGLPAAAVIAVVVSIIGIVIIRPSAKGVLG